MGGGTSSDDKPSPELGLGEQAGDAGSSSPSPAPSRPDATAAAPLRTKSRDRSAPLTRDNTRRVTIDHEALRGEDSPWPDGPRLYAEVITGSHRHLNLRPNGLGLTPRVSVSPNEALLVILQCPDNEPGDQLHVELVDGGTFDDSEMRGRVMKVPDNRELVIPVTSDVRNGFFNLAVRQAGRTRTVRLWSGPQEQLATGDAEP